MIVFSNYGSAKILTINFVSPGIYRLQQLTFLCSTMSKQLQFTEVYHLSQKCIHYATTNIAFSYIHFLGCPQGIVHSSYGLVGSNSAQLFDHDRPSTMDFPLYFSSRMASRVLLSTLAIPIPVSLSETEKHLELDENAREKSRRLANLLGLQNIPTRSSLVSDMVWSSLFL